MAEREGFEPSRPFWGLHDFESCAFDHSAISPWACPAKSTDEVGRKHCSDNDQTAKNSNTATFALLKKQRNHFLSEEIFEGSQKVFSRPKHPQTPLHRAKKHNARFYCRKTTPRQNSPSSIECFPIIST
jgi:hypothetical protein